MTGFFSAGSPLRRYVSLLMLAAVMMAPSVPVAAGVVAAWVAMTAAPMLVRRRRGQRALRPERGGGAGRGRGLGRGQGAARGRGVQLGVDSRGRAAVLTDEQLAAHGLIVGAAGAGKSTTLLRILTQQIGRGDPVVAIDMKGSPAFEDELRRAATAAGRQLRVWRLDGPEQWNPLAHGNPSALKDKLMATERFTEPHYKRAAERYVQTALQVAEALHPGRPPQLDEVVSLLEPRRLGAAVRRAPTPLADRVHDYLAGLTPDQVSAVRGLQTRLALLSESTAGQFLRPGDGGAIDLHQAVRGGDVVLFSLNSSVYGSLAAQVGALAIQDLISAAGGRFGRPDGHPPATVGIDEFSALGEDHILALLARGREAGLPTLVATQEMADLDRAGRGFRDQVLGIVGLKIIHRQDVPASARLVAEMIGSERVWERTEQVPGLFGPPGGGRGHRRLVDRFIVHPDVIKTLPRGQAMVLTKLPAASVARVAVSPPAAGQPPPLRPGLARGRPRAASAGPDAGQPPRAPGPRRSPPRAGRPFGGRSPAAGAPSGHAPPGRGGDAERGL